MMYLKVLKAKNGDSLLVSGDFDGVNRNILIDGGPSAAYKRGTTKGDLYKTLEEIKSKNERIDLFILSHVDDDHIAGPLKAFKSNELLEQLVDKVWFNSGRLIHKHFEVEEDASKLLDLDYLRTDSDADNYTSIGQGVKFENAITDSNVWDRKLIIAGQEHDFYGAKITILSPTITKLEKLLDKWESEAPDSITSGSNTDYDQSFEELLTDDIFEEDSAPHNGSSIAMLVEYNESKLLLLADAHDEVVSNSIRKLNDEEGILYSEENPIEIDYVKLSHHGSKYNTSPNFLKLIKSKNYIISTDGSRHGLPNKRTLARITRHQPEANFLFNYPIVVDRLFTTDELSEQISGGSTFDECDQIQI